MIFLAIIVPAAVAAKTNIVLIMADDLGYGDLGCYGSRLNSTPHIDALASSGLRFTDFHSAGPMCSPTRAAMLTGQYQQRFGRVFDSALSGINHRDIGLPHDVVTLAEILKEEGYATACFGKWHLGYQPPWLPPDHGFDVFRGLASGDGDFHTQIDRSGNEDWWHNNEIAMEKGYTTDLITKHSVEFIKQHHNEPFFLYVPHLGIHFPWQGPEDPRHRKKGTSYHNDKWGRIPNPSDVSPHVKAMIESLDQSTGQIMAALESQKLVEKTMVIFTSDNGGYLSYGENFHNISSNGALRGQKTELFEGGHRVPTIISWPGKIAANVTDVTAHSVDLFPTLASLAEVPLKKIQTDGIKLTSHLFEGKSLPDRMLFWRANSDRAVRDGRWKLYVQDTEKPELYDLDKDLGEQHNLANEHVEITNRLLAAWARWEADVNLHWISLNSGVETSIRGLDAVDTKICWFGTKGGVGRTIDSGKSWQVTQIDTELDFRDLEAIDAQHCIAMSAGPGQASRIYRTSDGGTTWQLTYQNDILKGFFNGMAFRDDQHGILAGDPLNGRLFLLATKDGGHTWQRIAEDTAPRMQPGEHAFAASGTHLAVNDVGHVWVTSGGSVARVFRSTDWGGTWETITTPMIAGEASTGIFSVALSPGDSQTAIAVGGDYKKAFESKDNVMHTSDGGSTWQLVINEDGNSRFPFRSCVNYLNTDTIIAVGPSGSNVSRDAGVTWQVLGKGSGYHTLSTAGGVIWAAGADGRIGILKLSGSPGD